MVHELSDEVQRALCKNVDWSREQPPEAVPPVLLILNYCPPGRQGLLSIAFDMTGGPKCWLTASKAREINGAGPRYHPDYRKFEHGGETFHPYSVESFPAEIFASSHALFTACRHLYEHAVLY